MADSGYCCIYELLYPQEERTLVRSRLPAQAEYGCDESGTVVDEAQFQSAMKLRGTEGAAGAEMWALTK